MKTYTDHIQNIGEQLQLENCVLVFGPIQMYTIVCCMSIQLQKSEDTYEEYINLLHEEDEQDLSISLQLQTGLLHSFTNSRTKSSYALR